MLDYIGPSQYDADDGKDEEKPLLHAAAEEGSIDVMELLLEQGVDINECDAKLQTACLRWTER